MSGTVTVTPGYTWTAGSDVLTNAKLNQTANPSMKVGAGGITGREITFGIMPISPQTKAVLFEDFLQVAPAIGAATGLIGNNRLTRVSSGTNCTVESSPATAPNAGRVVFTDCVDAGGSGFCMIRGTAGTEQWVLGSGEITVEWKFTSPSLLSGVNDVYTLYIGLANGRNDLNGQSDGVYFSYTNTVSSGAWIGMTTASSVTTSVVGSVMTISTSYNLKAVINAAATSVNFFVNGTSIGTSTTNIPTAALTYICGMNDTVSSAVSISFFADWVRIQQTFTNTR